MSENEQRAALLDRWAELAPKECRRVVDRYGLVYHDLLGAAEGNNTLRRPYHALDQYAILGHALTCAARRGLEISVVGYRATEWHACVGATASIEDRAPDIAVLAAYVQALEAEAKPATS